MRHGKKKVTRFTRNMEILRLKPEHAQPVRRESPGKPVSDDSDASAFAIVETVTGPIAGTFGLSDVWERG